MDTRPLTRTRHAIAGVFLGAVAAGVFDLMFAFWFFGMRGRSPEWILQSIAAGWLGAPAFGGGLTVAVLGAVSHFAIMLVAATLFYLACRHWRILRAHPVAAGLAFGVAIYVVMNFVVVPMSAFPYRPSHALRTVIISLAAHMLLVGLPIAMAVCHVGLRGTQAHRN
jgi:hypothetical protein